MRSATVMPILAILMLSLFWGCSTQHVIHPDERKTATPRVSKDQGGLTKSTKKASTLKAPKIAMESILTPSRAESPEETAFLQGKLLLSQGMVMEAWQQWAPLLLATSDGDNGTIQSHVADAAWYEMITSYFNTGDFINTPYFLGDMLPSSLFNKQILTIQQLARLQSKDRLQNLLEIQPDSSILKPFLQVALADRLVQVEQEGEAQGLLQQANQWNVTSVEAAQRLSEQHGDLLLRVGLLLPLSDRWVRMGEHLLHAAQKALSDYRDVPIELIVGDSGSSKEESRDGIHHLISQGVDVVIGPVFHASVKPAAEIAAANGIPIITMNPHTETSRTLSGVYSNALHPKRQARIMAQYAVLEKNYRRLVVLAPDTEYGHSMSEAFFDQAQELGGSVVYTAYFPPNTLDFSTWLKPLEPPEVEKTVKANTPLELVDALKLHEAMEPPKPDFDAMFIPASARHVRLIAPQAAFFGVGVPDVALLGTSLWNRKELLIEGTDYLNGAVFCDTSMEEKAWFKQVFQQTWQEEPSTLAVLTYDGIAILAQLLRDQRLGGENWRDGLTRTQSFQGASGPVRFLENGHSMRNYHLFDIAKGQVRFLQLAPELFPDQPG